MSLVRVSSRRSSWLLALSAATTLWGCSFLYDLQTTQCEVNQDCRDLGPQFSESICVNRVCVEDDGAGATGGSSGSSGSSGTSGGGKGGSGGSSTEAGAGGTSGDGAGGASGKGGSGGSGKGGSGGASATGGSSGGDVGGAGSSGAECETNAECMDAHNDQAYICQDGSCVGLLNANCPVLLPSDGGLEYLHDAAKPLIVGGFANLTNDMDPKDSQAAVNWDLAFYEFNDSTSGGFPDGDERRPVLAVVCKTATDVTANMQHLAGTLRVPGVLTTLSPDNLLAAYAYTKSDEYVEAGGKSVFFMSTGSADQRLASLPDNGLVWHQLGDPRVLARTMAGLLSLVEPVVEERRQAFFDENSTVTGVEDPNEVDLRVTLVQSDDVTMTDVANVLTAPSTEDTSTMLFFNGMAAIDQQGDGTEEDPGNFRRVRIDSIRNHNPPDVAEAISDVAAHPPHVIVAMGTSEFASHVMPAIEQAWSSGTNTASLPRPHYLMSHFIYLTNELRMALAANASYAPNDRMLGVAYASAQDSLSKALYNDYLGRLRASYMGSLTLEGTENYYDGAYALLYALAAAAGTRDDPTGIDIRDGLDRVLNPEAASISIGPTNINATVNNLSSNVTYDMGLWGTMGPPDFDRPTGTRITPTSAWCIEYVGDAWTYRPDGLLFNPEDRSYTPADTVPTCLQPYAP